MTARAQHSADLAQGSVSAVAAQLLAYLNKLASQLTTASKETACVAIEAGISVLAILLTSSSDGSAAITKMVGDATQLFLTVVAKNDDDKVVLTALVGIDELIVPTFVRCIEHVSTDTAHSVFKLLVDTAIKHSYLREASVVLEKLAGAEFLYVVLRVGKAMKRHDPATMSLMHVIHALFTVTGFVEATCFTLLFVIYRVHAVLG